MPAAVPAPETNPRGGSAGGTSRAPASTAAMRAVVICTAPVPVTTAACTSFAPSRPFR